MATDLHPDIVEAIREFSHTKLGRRYDRFTRRKYGLPGWKVQAKTVAGEFGGRSTRSGRGVVSSAGARGPAQFIPSTRQDFINQYGLDPWRSDAEAVKGMALHHLKRGGIAGYNPGMPTYEDYILDQRLNRQDRRALRGGSKPLTLHGPQRTDVTLGTKVIPGQSFAADRESARRQLLLGGDFSMDKLLAYKQSINSMQDVPDRTVPGDIQVKHRRGPKVEIRTGAPGSRVKQNGKVHEVFYDPAGRYYDEGNVVKGAIGGHGTHVHVSADPALADALGRLAQGMGLHVSENETFDHVDPVHTKGSYHYKDMAIDVSGDPAKMRKFYRIAMQEARRRGR